MPDRTKTRKMLKENIDHLAQKRKELARMTARRLRQELKRTEVDRQLVDKQAKVIVQVCEAKDDHGQLLYQDKSIRDVKVTELLAQDDDFDKKLKYLDARNRDIISLRLKEALTRTEIKSLEIMEQLYLIDMENV